MSKQLQAQLGNVAAHEAVRKGNTQSFVALPKAERTTTVQFPDGVGIAEAFTTITAAGGAWAYHSAKPPAWVESSSKPLAELLASHFHCPVGRPTKWPQD